MYFMFVLIVLIVCSGCGYEVGPGSCDVLENYVFSITGLRCKYNGDISFLFNGFGRNEDVELITFDTFSENSFFKVTFPGVLQRIQVFSGSSELCTNFDVPIDVSIVINDIRCIFSKTTITQTDIITTQEWLTNTVTKTLTAEEWITATKTLITTIEIAEEWTVDTPTAITVTISPSTVSTSTVTVTLSASTVPSNVPQEKTNGNPLPVWLQAFLGSLLVSLISLVICLVVFFINRHKKKQTTRRTLPLNTRRSLHIHDPIENPHSIESINLFQVMGELLEQPSLEPESIETSFISLQNMDSP